jgi:hypothetical protein
MMEISDIIGNIGVACFLVAYFMLQKGRLTHVSDTYLGLNLAGALMVMSSLLIHWNLPAFLLEAAWALISIYGIYKHIYLPRMTNKP